jgi:hypothetical protein
MSEQHLEIERKNLLFLSKVYKNIRININEFTDILKWGHPNDFNPITVRAILQSGFYGTVGQAKIWVSKYEAPGHVSVSNLDITDIKNKDDSKWLPSVPLRFAHQIDRYYRLKAFL